ncbi:hypothetical protein CPB84DRAFT_1384102 [Gymnopilus junonius]|uniref:Uncharacterized protein n=1 Tax=Gymnopilus junonius TaxID=109634 RepID=A0A9P5TK77_GYMJU|nr:hypothetical protein CPB84DRAFT_1384102 [Gymnopilus junonius]
MHFLASSSILKASEETYINLTSFSSPRRMIPFLWDIPSLETLYLSPHEHCYFKPHRFFKHLAETWCSPFLLRMINLLSSQILHL